MEAVALVSSVLTLVQVVAASTKIIGVISRQHASSGAAVKLSAHASYLATKLEYLKKLDAWAVHNAKLLPRAAQDYLQAAVQTAHEKTLASLTFCRSYLSTKKNNRVRNMLWLLRDEVVWEELNSHVQQVEIALDFAVKLIQLSVDILYSCPKVATDLPIASSVRYN